MEKERGKRTISQRAGYPWNPYFPKNYVKKGSPREVNRFIRRSDFRRETGRI